MARMPYPDPTRLTQMARDTLGSRPVNVARMMAGASPAVFRAFTDYGSAFFRNSSLSGRLREIAILRVGHLSNSKYEVFQHEAIGRMVGLSEEDLSAIADGGVAAQRLGPDGMAVVNFVDDLVCNVGAREETLAAVSEHLDQQQVLDLILLSGFYMMVCRFLETTGVEIDDTLLDWGAAMKK